MGAPSRYYVAQVDDFDVLTVERFEGIEDDAFDVATVAEIYPEVIYFEVEAPAPTTMRVTIDVDVTDCAPVEHWDWEDLVGIDTRFISAIPTPKDA